MIIPEITITDSLFNPQINCFNLYIAQFLTHHHIRNSQKHIQTVAVSAQ